MVLAEEPSVDVSVAHGVASVEIENDLVAEECQKAESASDEIFRHDIQEV